MTPRSQLQPGHGITPEPKLNQNFENATNIFLSGWFSVIVYFLILMIDLISYLMLFCLLFFSAEFCSFHPWPGHREARGERERRGQWAAFIGVKSDYCWCCYCCSLSFPGWRVHHSSSGALGDTLQLSSDPGQDTRPTPTTYTVQSRRQARSENKVYTRIC